MIRPPRPDPLRDELTEEAKADLVIAFAELKLRFQSGYHVHWRTQEQFRNNLMNPRFNREL